MLLWVQTTFCTADWVVIEVCSPHRSWDVAIPGRPPGLPIHLRKDDQAIGISNTVHNLLKIWGTIFWQCVHRWQKWRWTLCQKLVPQIFERWCNNRNIEWNVKERYILGFMCSREHLVIVCQRFCEPARLRIAYCLFVRASLLIPYCNSICGAKSWTCPFARQAVCWGPFMFEEICKSELYIGGFGCFLHVLGLHLWCTGSEKSSKEI